MRIFTYINLGSLAICALLLSCESKTDRTIKTHQPYRKNLFNPLYLDKILNAPNVFGSIWNVSNINQLDVRKISVVLKGGNSSDDDLEKHQFIFDSLGQNTEYNYYSFSQSKDILNQTGIQYSNGNITKINIYKYLGMGNLPPVFSKTTNRYQVFISSTSRGNNDSLFFFPSVENPKIIIDKMGSFVNQFEIFVPEETGNLQILKEISRIDTNLTQYDLSHKIITYTKNGLPMESFNLGQDWNQMDLLKKWEYNEDNQPISYKEWLHGTLVNDISVFYNENALPKRIIYNRKKYVLIYRKN